MGLGCSPGSGFDVYLRFPQLFHALGKCIASSISIRVQEATVTSLSIVQYYPTAEALAYFFFLSIIWGSECWGNHLVRAPFLKTFSIQFVSLSFSFSISSSSRKMMSIWEFEFLQQVLFFRCVCKELIKISVFLLNSPPVSNLNHPHGSLWVCDPIVMERSIWTLTYFSIFHNFFFWKTCEKETPRPSIEFCCCCIVFGMGIIFPTHPF